MDHMTGALDLVQRMFEVAARRVRQPISTVLSGRGVRRTVVPSEGVAPLAIAALADYITIAAEPKHHQRQNRGCSELPRSQRAMRLCSGQG